MAVKSYALTTGQRVADFGGLGTLAGANLTRMERIVDSVTEFIENYIGFRIQQATYTNEEYSTEEGQILNLKNSFVDSSSTFTLQRRTGSLDEDEWETIDVKYYHVDYDAGIVYGAGGWGFPRTRNGFRVTYTAGYDFDNNEDFLSDTEAGDIEMVAWELCLAVYNRRGGSLGVKSERIGDYTVVYGKSLKESEDVKNVLDKYAGLDTISVLTPIQI